MRKIVTIILTSIFSILIISCEDYLVPSSSSVYSEDMTFSNLDFAEKAVNGVYETLVRDQLYNYGIGWFKVDSDIEFITAENNGSLVDVSHMAANENASILSRVWTQYFIGIERANVCIKNIPESPMWTDENKAGDAKRLYGEAVTLRAFLYFDCIRYWGDIPFSTEPQNEEDLYSYKTDRDSIYEYLIQDLKDVEQYVPWMSETGSSTRITKGFVKGLRARMALAYAGYSLRNKTFETRRGRYWEDYYKIANQECKEIIESQEHALNPSFEGVFRTLHEYSMDQTYREVLYEVGMSRLNGGRVLAKLIGMYTTGNTYGLGGGTFKTSPAYYYSFDNKDLRRNTSVELYQYSDAKQVLNSPSYLYLCKWRRAWLNPNMGGDMANAQRLGINWPIMRYSDILLMYAETENEINNGPTQAAKNALAQVRQRAFEEIAWDENVTQYIESISGSKEDFFNAIVDERAWEFGGEFMRKDDLIRWNLFGTKVNEMKEDYMKIINGEKYTEKVSNYIFWKNNGNDIEILNADKILPDAQQPGYTRSTWYPKLSQYSIETVQTILDRIASGYDPAKNNHLLPIENSIISTSRGTLNNDQIPE